jgi:hypothetical protein
MDNRKLKIVNQFSTKTTCFQVHQENNVDCNKEKCNNWINCSRYNNCSIIAAKSGPKTLEEIGEIFNLTRMRICQIEKNVSKKLKETC